MKYYYLIAGLPDIRPDDTKDVPTMDVLKHELEAQLSASDLELLRLIYARYDNNNLLKYLENREALLDPLGALDSNDWHELTALLEEHEKPRDARLRPYMLEYYRIHTDETDRFGGLLKEDLLATLYYEYAMRCKNRFLSNWFAFNLDVNNLLTAIACRKHGFDPQRFIIGDNETARILRRSSARDYGLTGLFEPLDEVMKIAEEPNLLTREKMIDRLKWQWLDEQTFFHYFSVERILAFVLKCELINRWRPLDIETGTAIFRKLLDSMKENLVFELTT